MSFNETEIGAVGWIARDNSQSRESAKNVDVYSSPGKKCAAIGGADDGAKFLRYFAVLETCNGYAKKCSR